jgi:hypothetical protein
MATAAGLPGCSIECFTGFPGPGVDVSSVRMGWDASARTRLGYWVTPELLLYGTGGVAWQDVRTSGTCQPSVPDRFCLVLPGNRFGEPLQVIDLRCWRGILSSASRRGLAPSPTCHSAARWSPRKWDVAVDQRQRSGISPALLRRRVTWLFPISLGEASSSPLPRR